MVTGVGHRPPVEEFLVQRLPDPLERQEVVVLHGVTEYHAEVHVEVLLHQLSPEQVVPLRPSSLDLSPARSCPTHPSDRVPVPVSDPPVATALPREVLVPVAVVERVDVSSE